MWAPGQPVQVGRGRALRVRSGKGGDAAVRDCAAPRAPANRIIGNPA